MRHALKTWPEPFEALLRGDKTCEIRVDDRDPPFAAGDELLLQCWDPVDSRGYDGRELLVDVTHVQRGFGLPERLCVMSVAPKDRSPRVTLFVLPGPSADGMPPLLQRLSITSGTVEAKLDVAGPSDADPSFVERVVSAVRSGF